MGQVAQNEGRIFEMNAKLAAQEVEIGVLKAQLADIVERRAVRRDQDSTTAFKLCVDGLKYIAFIVAAAKGVALVSSFWK